MLGKQVKMSDPEGLAFFLPSYPTEFNNKNIKPCKKDLLG